MRRIASRAVLKWGRNPAPEGVSVAVSLYNYARYIEECLDSIAAQDFEGIQLIVVDDCSSRDDSLAIAESWMRKNKARFPSGLLIRHETNCGLAEARNTAFEASSHDAVFVMDADNVIYPSCIRKLRRAMAAGDADAVYSQLVMFDGTTDVGLADYWSKTLLAKGPYIDAMALVKKSCWARAGGYSHIEGGWEDYDFWCKLAEVEAHVSYVPELLCRYRVHESSMLRTESAKSYDRLYNLISLRHPWTRLRQA